MYSKITKFIGDSGRRQLAVYFTVLCTGKGTQCIILFRIKFMVKKITIYGEKRKTHHGKTNKLFAPHKIEI